MAATFMVMHRGGSSNNAAAPTTVPAHVAAHKPAQAKHAAAGPAAKHAAAAPAKPVKHAVVKHTAAKKSAPIKVHTPAGQEAGASVGLPLKVAQAFAKKQVVVLYFGAKGADDTLTADSVRSLKASAGHGVAVFMDKLSNLAEYRRVVEGLDVSQAPSIVLIDRHQQAQVLEGFIDAGSLRQDVADVTR
ncbi:MAG TPA: hypothetical protein VJU60_07155 [Thermoleophilaceae bacterium]|nr:hypothetical protein [Thermoleophilaceae bacterium]